VSPEEIGFGVGLNFVDQVMEHSVRVQEDIVGIAIGDLLVEYCVEFIETDIVEPDLGRFSVASSLGQGLANGHTR